MAMERGSGPSPASAPPAVATPGFAVFVDSSLDTHLAMLASPDDTVAQLKRRIEAEHALCFPNVGQVAVRALKVKRRASFYHLSDSMIVRNAFDGIKGTRFLYIDVEASSLGKHQALTAEDGMHLDSRLMQIRADKTQDFVMKGIPGEKRRILTDTGAVNETATVPEAIHCGSLSPHVAKSKSVGLEKDIDEHPILGNMGVDTQKHTSVEVRGVHHESVVSPSEPEGSDPNVPEMQKRAREDDQAAELDIDHMVLVQGEKAHTGKEKDRRDLDAEPNGGIVSTVIIKKGKSRKRSNALQDDHLLEDQSKHPSLEKRMRKKRRHEPVANPITGNDFEPSIHAKDKETASLENGRVENMVHDKHKEAVVSSEGLSSKPPNGDSSLPQALTSDEKKTKKKKQSCKLLNEIESLIPSNACDMKSPHDIEESYAQAGFRDSLNKSSDAVCLEKEGTEKYPIEASKDNKIDPRKEFHAENAVDEAAENVANEVHPEDASGNNHVGRDNARTMVEEAVEHRHPVKVDSDDPSKANVGSSHRRRRKKSGKTELVDYPDKGHGGTIVLGEDAALDNVLVVDSEVPSKPNGKKPHRSRKELAKTLLPLYETGEFESAHSLGKEAVYKDRKKTSENILVHMGKEPKLVDLGEAAAFESLSKIDLGKPSDTSDRGLGHAGGDQSAGESCKAMLADYHHDPSKESAVANGEAGALGTTSVDSAVPFKPGDKKSRRSKKRSAKSDMLSYDHVEPEAVHSSGKEAAEENPQKSSDDHDELHKELKQGTFPDKDSAVGNLAQVDEVMLSGTDNTSSQASDKSSKEMLVDHHSDSNEPKGSVVAEEAVTLENSTKVDYVNPPEQKEKKPRHSRKKPAKTELPNHEFLQSESVQSLGKEASEKIAKNSVGAINVELGKESNSETVAREAAIPGSPANGDPVVPSNSIHLDPQVTEKNSKETLGNHHKGAVRKTKGSMIFGEVSAPGNPAVADFEVPPKTSDKKPRRSRKKSAKTQLTNHDPMMSEFSLPAEKEITKMSPKRTFENNNTNLAKESKSSIILGEAAAAENPAERDLVMPSNINDQRSYHQKQNLVKPDAYSHSDSDLVHASGDQVAQANLGKALETNLKTSGDRPSEGNLLIDTEQNVEGCGKEASQHHMVSAEELTSETEIRKSHNEKAEKREKDGDKTAQDSSQDLLNPSSSNEQHMHKKLSHDTDPDNHSLDGSLDQLTSKEQNLRKTRNQNTVKGRRNSSIRLGDTSSDLGSPQSKHNGLMTQKMLQDHNSIPRQVSRSKVKVPSYHERNDFMDSEHEVLEPRNDVFSAKIGSLGAPVVQNYSGFHSDVYPKEVMADCVASDDSTEEDTPYESKRYRVAVRKVPSRRFAEVLRNSNQKKTMLATSNTIFDGATSGSSDDEYEINNRKATTDSTLDNSSTSAESDGEIEQTQTMTKSSKTQAYMNSPGIESAANGKNYKGAYGGGDVLTQSSSVSRKSVPLSAILKSTSSYKKAKLTASQSQPEDSESQPIDVVLETQPDSALP